MPSFKYQALNAVGEKTTGTIKADDASSAIANLHSDSLTVLNIKESVGLLNLTGHMRRLQALRTPKDVHKAAFFRQLAMMIKSGHTLTEGLALCAETVDRKPLQDSLVRILVKIHNGGTSFANAVAEEKRIFPAFAARILATGERSGELVAALERVANHIEQDSQIRVQLINSMIYPGVIVLIALTVFTVLTINVVPKLARVFERSSVSELPYGAQLMLDISAWISNYGLYAGAGVIALLALIVASYKIGLTKKLFDGILINTPFIGTNIRNTSMAQMGWTMSMLLQSGQSIIESLEFLSKNTGNASLSKSFGKARDGIVEGRNLSTSLDQPHIPVLVKNMYTVGERSGELETAARSLGEHFQRESQRRLKTTMAVMEPAMILLVAGMVAFIYISFFKAMLLANSGL